MAYTSRVNQINAVVDSIYGQMVGGTTLTASNPDGFTSMGNKVLSSSSDKESFYNILMDRVGKVLNMAENWTFNKRGFYMNVLEFGNALQILTFEAGSTSADDAWLGVNSWQSTTRGTQNDPYSNTVNTSAKQYIHTQRAAYAYKDVLPTIQIKTAWTSNEHMAAFIGGIYQTHKNALNAYAEAIGNMVANRAMHECYTKANALSDARPAIFRNLLAEYNVDVLGLGGSITASEGTITYPSGWVKADNALKDAGFMAYAIEEIQLLVKRFGDVSRVFNIDAHTTQSQAPAVEILQSFASAAKVAFANTYHNDILSLPNYAERSFWQSSTDTRGGVNYAYDFVTCSSMNVQFDVSGSPYSALGRGIIGFVYDTRAIMQTVEDYRSYSLFNPDDEVLNTYDKANVAYAINTFLNMAVLQIADPTASGSTVSVHKNGFFTESAIS